MGNLRDYVALKWETDCGGAAPADTLLQSLGIENEIQVGDLIFDISTTPKTKYECVDATVGASFWEYSEPSCAAAVIIEILADQVLEPGTKNIISGI